MEARLTPSREDQAKPTPTLLITGLNETVQLPLHNALRQLDTGQPDIYTCLLFSLRRYKKLAKNTLLPSTKALIKSVSGTMKQPLELLNWLEEKKPNVLYQDLLSPQPKRKLKLDSSLFKSIKLLTEQLKTLLQQLSNDNSSGSLQDEIRIVIKAYEEYCQQLCHGQQREREACLTPTVRLVRATMSSFYLAPAAISGILGNLQASTGNHEVAVYQGVYFKPYPDAPGAEFAVNTRNQILGGQSYTPIELIKLERTVRHINGSFEKESIPVLASLAVPGLTCQRWLQEDPIAKAYFEKEKKLPLEPQAFSAMVLFSLRIDPSDGKRDNYIVQRVVNANDSLYRFVDIDHDLCFADPVIQRADDQHITGIRCLLYFQPQMRDSIHDEIRKQLLDFSPELAMIQWLTILAKKEEDYYKFRRLGLFGDAELEGRTLCLVKEQPEATAIDIHKLYLYRNTDTSLGYVVKKGKYSDIIAEIKAGEGEDKLAKKHFDSLLKALKELKTASLTIQDHSEIINDVTKKALFTLLLKRGHSLPRLPLRFVPGKITKYYQRDRIIKRLFDDYPGLTHEQLLKELEPAVWAFYQGILEVSASFNRFNVIDALYANSVEGSMTTQGITFERVIAETKNAEIRQILTDALSQAASFDDYRYKRTQTIRQAKEEFLQQLDFANLKPEVQRSILASLLQGFTDITELHFNQCGILAEQFTSERLPYLLKFVQSLEHLSHLTLNRCLGITLEYLQLVLDSKPNLHICLSSIDTDKIIWSALAAANTLASFSLLLSDGARLQLKPRAADAHLYLFKAPACRAQPVIDFLLAQGYAELTFAYLVNHAEEVELIAKYTEEQILHLLTWRLQTLVATSADATAYQTLNEELHKLPDPLGYPEDKWDRLWLQALDNVLNKSEQSLQNHPLHLALNLKYERGSKLKLKLMHLCARHGQINLIKTLISLGVSVNEVSADGSTPLHSAAANGQLATVNLLLAEGAKVDTKNQHGYTALHLATGSGHVAIIKILAKQGADIDAVLEGDHNYTSVHHVLRGWSPLEQEQQLAVIEELLLQGANVNAKDSLGNTPLHMVVSYTKPKNLLIDRLLLAGADTTAMNKAKKTPIECARVKSETTAEYIITKQKIIQKQQVDRIKQLELENQQLREENAMLRAQLNNNNSMPPSDSQRATSKITNFFKSGEK